MANGSLFLFVVRIADRVRASPFPFSPRRLGMFHLLLFQELNKERPRNQQKNLTFFYFSVNDPTYLVLPPLINLLILGTFTPIPFLGCFLDMEVGG